MTGTLGLFSLTDLFQLLASSARTGRLAVHHPQGLARIYFDRGRVSYADFGALIGEDAVYALFADERGTFEFQLGLPAPGVTVSGSTEGLLMEAIRRLDESKRGLSRLPDDAIPLAEDAEGSSPYGAYLGGQYTVREVAELAGAPLESVKAAVSELEAAGRLRFVPRKLRTARLVLQLSRRPLRAGLVALDAEILETWTRVLGNPPAQVACRRPDGRVSRFAVMGLAGAGPYLYAARETLFQADLSAKATLLVRPVPGGRDGGA